MHRRRKTVFFRMIKAYIRENADALEGITARELSDWTGCHIKTARRWLKESHGVSAANRTIIELQARGHIVPEPWRDFFKFVGDFAVIGDAYTFSQSELRGYWLIAQYKGWYEGKCRELEQADEYIRYLEGQLARASVSELPPDRLRESATQGRSDNPRFNRPRRLDRR